MATVSCAALDPVCAAHVGRTLQAAHQDTAGSHRSHREGSPPGAGVDGETHRDAGRECSGGHGREPRLPGRGWSVEAVWYQVELVGTQPPPL